MKVGQDILDNNKMTRALKMSESGYKSEFDVKGYRVLYKVD